MLVTTKFEYADYDQKLITGKEVYPIIGDYPIPINKIWPKLIGLKSSWNCIEKAQIVQDILKEGSVIIGSLIVWSSNFRSSYGFEFNPPYEFHAWVELNSVKIDVSLPGVIEKGLNSIDEYGPYLMGITPSILSGTPPKFLQYNGFKKIQ